VAPDRQETARHAAVKFSKIRNQMRLVEKTVPQRIGGVRSRSGHDSATIPLDGGCRGPHSILGVQFREHFFA
jgi:hypothetical protein